MRLLKWPRIDLNGPGVQFRRLALARTSKKAKVVSQKKTANDKA
jgi:hypothetical protein